MRASEKRTTGQEIGNLTRYSFHATLNHKRAPTFPSPFLLLPASTQPPTICYSLLCHLPPCCYAIAFPPATCYLPLTPFCHTCPLLAMHRLPSASHCSDTCYCTCLLLPTTPVPQICASLLRVHGSVHTLQTPP